MGIFGGAILVAMAAWAGVAPLGASQAPAADQAKPNPVEHAIAGTVESVDSAAKTVAIKTADGSVKVFKLTEKSVVEGAKAGASYTVLGAEKGSHVVVTYSGEAANATVSGVKVVGKGTVKVSEGTVTKVDEAAKTVTVKTASGSEEVYHFSEKVTVDSAKGIAKGTAQGAKVSVYYTEEAGKKVAHLFKHF
jgi:arginine repressor